IDDRSKPSASPIPVTSPSSNPSTRLPSVLGRPWHSCVGTTSRRPIFAIQRGGFMQTVQRGDRVQVHYVFHFQDGDATPSRKRDRGLLQLTVGVDHSRLPGLGLSLLGLAVGEHLSLHVP